MSVLSDRDINYRLETPEDPVRIVVSPLVQDVQPASVDLTLSSEFVVYEPPLKDPYGHDFWEPFDMSDLGEVETKASLEERYVLLPGEFVLGSTYEWIEVPDDLVGRVEGKSSLGRLGLLIHATAGFIDPGFRGKVTLEMFNLNHRPIILRPGRAICQISFLELSSRPLRPYGHPELGSHYQDQEGVVPSRYEG